MAAANGVESRCGQGYRLDDFDLDRFIEAQAPLIERVRAELARGAKRSHWMWFIFPQLRGLGLSATAQFFGLDGLAEARAYLAHPVLGARLVECAALVNQVEGVSALQIFGSPDDLKFRSCVTLFATLQPEPFKESLRIFYNAEPDPKTLALLHAA